MPEEKVPGSQVKIKVIPSGYLYDAMQAKIEKIGDPGDDEYFCGFKAALDWVSAMTQPFEVEIPTEVLPPDEGEDYP